MPVRVYSIPESLDQDIPHIASIVDKKQNSEQFLTPLQLTQHVLFKCLREIGWSAVAKSSSQSTTYKDIRP